LPLSGLVQAVTYLSCILEVPRKNLGQNPVVLAKVISGLLSLSRNLWLSIRQWLLLSMTFQILHSVLQCCVVLGCWQTLINYKLQCH